MFTNVKAYVFFLMISSTVTVLSVTGQNKRMIIIQKLLYRLGHKQESLLVLFHISDFTETWFQLAF